MKYIIKTNVATYSVINPRYSYHGISGDFYPIRPNKDLPKEEDYIKNGLFPFKREDEDVFTSYIKELVLED